MFLRLVWLAQGLSLVYLSAATRESRTFESEVENTEALSSGDFDAIAALLGDFDEKASEAHPESHARATTCADDPTLCQSRVAYSTLVKDDGTELYANKFIATKLFENDVVLTLDQARALVADDDGLRRQRRKVIDGSKYRWQTTTIPYRFGGLGTLSGSWQNAIKDALQHWEKHTCMRFRQNGPGRDHIVFIQGSGCYSSVGRTGGRQQISIGAGCKTRGIIAHEVGHAMGFWHEQSRPDRDAYIDVNWQNMIDGTKGNFQKRNKGGIVYYGGPYDLGSVMHYGSKSFSIRSNLRTIETKDTSYGYTIGQRIGPSFIDVKQVNRMYCSHVCRDDLDCRHGGYADPNDCRKCKCPDGLGGARCEKVATSSCGADLLATSEWQTVRWSSVRKYQECFWRISAPSGSLLELKVPTVHLPCFDTCSNYVELKYGRDLQQTGPRMCCEAPRGKTFVSARNEAIVIYRTTGRGSSSYRGFEVQYKTHGNGGKTDRGSSFKGSSPEEETVERKPTQSKGSRSGEWATWGAWSECSEKCGACGVRRRSRECARGRCDEDRRRQRQRCGLSPCPDPDASTEEVVESEESESVERRKGKSSESSEENECAGMGLLGERFCTFLKWMRGRRMSRRARGRAANMQLDDRITPEEMTLIDQFYYDGDQSDATPNSNEPAAIVLNSRLKKFLPCCKGFHVEKDYCVKNEGWKSRRNDAQDFRYPSGEARQMNDDQFY